MKIKIKQIHTIPDHGTFFLLEDGRIFYRTWPKGMFQELTEKIEEGIKAAVRESKNEFRRRTSLLK